MAMNFNAVLEPDIATNERSALRNNLVAGNTVIPVENARKFEADNYLCILEFGKETAELRKILSVNEAARTVTVEIATIYPHYQGDTVIQFLYNKRGFYRYNTITLAYEQLTAEGSPKEIEVDNPQGTYFEDSDGTQSDKYKATYLNVAKGVETSLLDAKEIYGGGVSTDLISLYRIRYSAGFKENYAIEDNYLDQYRQDAQGEIWAALRLRYQFPLTKNSSFLRNIVRDLAVGMIWMDQYSGNSEKIRVGLERMKEARGRLKGLANGTYTLYDEALDVEQTETGKGGGLSFFPDENTEDTDDERIFTLNQKF
jgi:hypothetical protein